MTEAENLLEQMAGPFIKTLIFRPDSWNRKAGRPTRHQLTMVEVNGSFVPMRVCHSVMRNRKLILQ
jgi:hypothetical protein